MHTIARARLGQSQEHGIGPVSPKWMAGSQDAGHYPELPRYISGKLDWNCGLRHSNTGHGVTNYTWCVQCKEEKDTGALRVNQPPDLMEFLSSP